ncbi:type VI secretion system contractile sheath small subunit [Microvirga sp. 0TCS3.31]
MSDTGQKFIRRNRPPRVQISYEDPYDAERKIELPFVMGVLADLSGNNPGAEKPAIDDRKLLEFDMDIFEERMAAVAPGVTFMVKNTIDPERAEKLPVSLQFKKMEDFGPAAIARQVPELAKLLEARQQLSNLLRYMDGKIAASDKIKELLANPNLMAALKDRIDKRSESSEAEQEVR